MRRVVIVGRSGSGKSRLARRLGRQLRLPVIHLDQLYWEPGWREPDIAEFRARVAAAIAGNGWISDGSYALTTSICVCRVLMQLFGLNARAFYVSGECSVDRLPAQAQRGLARRLLGTSRLDIS